MKCIRLFDEGVPIRTTDAKAYRIVEVEHDGDYCPKNVWRNWWEQTTDAARAKAETQLARDRASVATHMEPQRNKRRRGSIAA